VVVWESRRLESVRGDEEEEGGLGLGGIRRAEKTGS
jgi:hypothetical protein